jgi:hypothetical protein
LSQNRMINLFKIFFFQTQIVTNFHVETVYRGYTLELAMIIFELAMIIL